MDRHIAVIGAGVVGLSTALCMQKEFASTSVTIFAEKFDDDTLSSGAGGIFRPEPSIDFNQEHLRKWCGDSLTHFLELVKSSEASEAGMQLVSGYHLSSSYPIQNPLVEDFLTVRNLKEEELKIFPSRFKNGTFYTTVVTDCRYYLPWMKKKFEKGGGKIIQRYISSLSEIPDQFDIIVNCTGLGAKYLVNDDMLTPVRGQTIKVKAPWIKHFYYGDEVYIVPGLDYVTLGGVKDFGSWNMTVNPYQKQYIWDKCTELVPSLKKASIVWDWVGLRPYRPKVRVDACIMKCNRKYKMIVNNYGHGGHGVTLSWGTAQEASKIAKRLSLKEDISLSKL